MSTWWWGRPSRLSNWSSSHWPGLWMSWISLSWPASPLSVDPGICGAAWPLPLLSFVGQGHPWCLLERRWTSASFLLTLASCCWTCLQRWCRMIIKDQRTFKVEMGFGSILGFFAEISLERATWNYFCWVWQRWSRLMFLPERYKSSSDVYTGSTLNSRLEAAVHYE